MITVSKRGQTAQRHGNVFVHKAQSVGISPSTTQPKPKPNQNTMHVDDGWTFNPPTDDWTFHQDDANPDNPVFSFPIKCGEKYSISGDVTIFSGTGKIRIRLGKDDEDLLIIHRPGHFTKSGIAGNENNDLRFIADNNHTLLAVTIENLHMEVN